MEARYAEFQKLRNDLYWTFWHYGIIDGTEKFHKHTWIGYDDGYWWENISPLKSIHECDCGKKFKLDYQTNRVEEWENKND